MQRLSDSQKKFLREAAEQYHKSLPGSPGEGYLAGRGLAFPSLLREEHARFKLGYVAEPLAGHEMFRGFLAIPYLRWSQHHGWSVVSIRFRCIEDHEHIGHGKYMTAAGDRPRLYNTLALLRNTPDVAISEGELDAIAAEACGVPTVGVAGANAWQRYYREPFLGYRSVFIFADGDEAGLAFANSIARQLPNGKIIPCPPGEDVNSLFLKQGKQGILRRLR